MIALLRVKGFVSEIWLNLVVSEPPPHFVVVDRVEECRGVHGRVLPLRELLPSRRRRPRGRRLRIEEHRLPAEQFLRRSFTSRTEDALKRGSIQEA